MLRRIIYSYNNHTVAVTVHSTAAALPLQPYTSPPPNLQRHRRTRPATYPHCPLHPTPREGEGIGPDHRRPMPRPSDGEVSTLAVARASSGGLMATHMASRGGGAGVEVSRGSEAAVRFGTQDHAACVPKRTACCPQAGPPRTSTSISSLAGPAGAPASGSPRATRCPPLQ